MAGNRKFSPPYVFGEEFVRLSWQDQDVYTAEAEAWLRENGIAPEDIETAVNFINQFRPAAKPQKLKCVHYHPMAYKYPLGAADLPPDEQKAAKEAYYDWLEMSDKYRKFVDQVERNLITCTPKMISDIIGGFGNEITPGVWEKLKKFVLASRIPGRVGEDGSLYFGDSCYRRPKWRG